MIVDYVWLLIWFVTGLLTFKYSKAKKYLTVVSLTFTTISIISLSMELSLISSVGIKTISWILTVFSYLIGANIGRYIRFDKISYKILLYLFAVLVILFFFS